MDCLNQFLIQFDNKYLHTSCFEIHRKFQVILMEVKMKQEKNIIQQEHNLIANNIKETFVKRTLDYQNDQYTFKNHEFLVHFVRKYHISRILIKHIRL